MRLMAITVLALLAISVSVQAQPSCGDPPRVDDRTLKGDLEGKAKLLSSWVGDAGLKGQIEAARSDVFSKYPDAGKARSDDYLEYMFCSFVLSDPKFSTQEKLRAIQEYRQAERQPVQSPPQVSTRGDQSPAVISKGDASFSYGAPPPPPTHPSPAAGSDQSPAAGSVHTEGNQSPAVNTGGAANFQYDAPAASPPTTPSPR